MVSLCHSALSVALSWHILILSLRTQFRHHLPGSLLWPQAGAHRRLRCSRRTPACDLTLYCLPRLCPTVFGQGLVSSSPCSTYLQELPTRNRSSTNIRSFSKVLQLESGRMPHYSPTQTGSSMFSSDLALVQEKDTYTDLGSDWWPSKQGLVCRSSNRQSALHQSSSNAAPVVVVPGEENQIMSLKDTNHSLPTS